jgi:hypothetical protein
LQVSTEDGIPNCDDQPINKLAVFVTKKPRTIGDDALRSLRVDHARKVRVQHPFLLVVLPVDLQEVSPEILQDRLKVVWTVAVGCDAVAVISPRSGNGRWDTDYFLTLTPAFSLV